jgi:hypothetical protein
MTAVQGLTSAGGFTPFANLKKIYILRFENGQKEMLTANFKNVVSGRNPEKDVRLKSGTQSLSCSKKCLDRHQCSRVSSLSCFCAFYQIEPA